MYYRYIGLDPGETTGVACFDAIGDCRELKQLRELELDDFLAALDVNAGPITFIIENYRIFGHKA